MKKSDQEIKIAQYIEDGYVEVEVIAVDEYMYGFVGDIVGEIRTDTDGKKYVMVRDQDDSYYDVDINNIELLEK